VLHGALIKQRAIHWGHGSGIVVNEVILCKNASSNPTHRIFSIILINTYKQCFQQTVICVDNASIRDSSGRTDPSGGGGVAVAGLA